MSPSDQFASRGISLSPVAIRNLVWLLRPSAGLLATLSSIPRVAAISLAVALSLGARTARRQERGSDRQLHALAKLGQAFNGATIDEALGLALATILEHTGAAAVHLWLVNPETNKVEGEFHDGLEPDKFAAQANPTDETVGAANSDDVQWLRALGFMESVCMPLRASSYTVGTLFVASRQAGGLTTGARRWLDVAGQILASGIGTLFFQARIARHEEEARQLWRAGLEVASAPDYAGLLRTVVDRVRELIGAEASALCLWDDRKHWWVVQGTSGETDAFEVGIKRIERREGGAVECPIIRFKYRQTHLDVPLEREGRVIGCICVASRQPREFSNDERSLLDGIAKQAAVAVDHAQQMEQAGQRAATTERERLAREMHDMLAQLLGFVNFKTGTVRELLAQGRTEQAQSQLAQLAALSQELYAETRELILGLRTEVSPERGLVPVLEEYAAHFQQLSGVETTIAARGLAEVRFAPSVEVQLIRVVQEALSNVRKHAYAPHARVRLEQHADQALIEIEDDGQGFDPANIARSLWPHFGLQSMRERVESIGGTFSIRSVKGQGTTILIQVPLVYRGV